MINVFELKIDITLFAIKCNIFFRKEMSPIKVRLSEDVYGACLSHALSTENEEIMGLLIGDIAEGDVGEKDEDTSDKVVSITQLKILQRLDKRKDRVEIR